VARTSAVAAGAKSELGSSKMESSIMVESSMAKGRVRDCAVVEEMYNNLEQVSSE
jgi:hypothetical protein